MPLKNSGPVIGGVVILSIVAVGLIVLKIVKGLEAKKKKQKLPDTFFTDSMALWLYFNVALVFGLSVWQFAAPAPRRRPRMRIRRIPLNDDLNEPIAQGVFED